MSSRSLIVWVYFADPRLADVGFGAVERNGGFAFAAFLTAHTRTLRLPQFRSRNLKRSDSSVNRIFNIQQRFLFKVIRHPWRESFTLCIILVRQMKQSQPQLFMWKRDRSSAIQQMIIRSAPQTSTWRKRDPLKSDDLLIPASSSSFIRWEMGQQLILVHCIHRSQHTRQRSLLACQSKILPAKRWKRSVSLSSHTPKSISVTALSSFLPFLLSPSSLRPVMDIAVNTRKI